jgi:hypothetical protein
MVISVVVVGAFNIASSGGYAARRGGRVAVTQCVGAAPKGGAQLAKGSCAATYLRRRHALLADDKDKPS